MFTMGIMQRRPLRHGPDNSSGSGLTNTEISETCANWAKREPFLSTPFLCQSHAGAYKSSV